MTGRGNATKQPHAAATPARRPPNGRHTKRPDTHHLHRCPLGDHPTADTHPHSAATARKATTRWPKRAVPHPPTQPRANETTAERPTHPDIGTADHMATTQRPTHTRDTHRPRRDRLRDDRRTADTNRLDRERSRDEHRRAGTRPPTQSPPPAKRPPNGRHEPPASTDATTTARETTTERSTHPKHTPAPAHDTAHDTATTGEAAAQRSTRDVPAGARAARRPSRPIGSAVPPDDHPARSVRSSGRARTSRKVSISRTGDRFHRRGALDHWVSTSMHNVV